MSTRKYLDQLFISKVRIKALRYFFSNQRKPIHLRGAVRELNEEINAVRRELSRMEKIDLLISERKGNRKYFVLNNDFPFFDELLGITVKSFGMGSEIIDNVKALGDIKFAALTQGFTKGLPIGKHQVDLVIVGDVNLPELKSIVEKEEKKLGRDIFYAVLSAADFDTRKKRKDQFVQELFMQDVVVLIGNRTHFFD